MTTLYLACPDDNSYYMYCDEAYKYNDLKDRVGFLLYNTAPTGQAIGILDFGIAAAAAFKSTTPRAFWLTPNSYAPTSYICTHSLIEPYQSHVPLTGTVKKCTTSETILPAGVSLYQLVSGSAKPWARVVVVRSADMFPKTTAV
jgi:hypothetical protein